MQKYTTKQLLEILEDENFEYDYHDCSVGNTNRELAIFELTELDKKYNLTINVEDGYPLDRIINTFVRSYDKTCIEVQIFDRTTRKFERGYKDSDYDTVEAYVENEYKIFTVDDIKNLLNELKEDKDSEVYKHYDNIINYLNKISENKDISYWIDYHKCLLIEEAKSKYSHIIKDFINKYLCRYYLWLSCDKTNDISKLDRKNIFEIEEFKNEFEIYLLV